MAALGAEWLISEFEFASDWPTWEMHPGGDEFVYLLSGSVELLLEEAAGVKSLALLDTGAVIVPRGVWHTAKVHAPSRMLHVTLGAGTKTRPV
jgi:quercetin dioxygenase-like cupin family protein